MFSYVCHLMCIFQYYKIPFDGIKKEKGKGVLVCSEDMKVYKTTNCGHVFWLYLRNSDIMTNKCDLKPFRDQQVFKQVSLGFEAKVV